VRKIRYGIIGLGAIATVHVDAINSSGNSEFIAAYDVLPEKTEQFCKKNGGHPYTVLSEFLLNPDIDVVSITTPSGFHLDPALKAIAAGKNVLIEKPLEITPERCQQIIDAARKQGVMVSSIFQTRFHEPVRLIKEAVDKGRFGRIVMADAQVKWFRSQEYYDSGSWRGTWSVDGGGTLMNQSIHAIDLLGWFIGPVKSVYAFCDRLAHERIEVEDTASALVRFENGAHGVIEGTTCAWPGSAKRIEICGTKGTVVLEEESLTQWKFAEETDEDDQIRRKYISTDPFFGGALDPMGINHEGHRLQFKDFSNAILNGTEPYITVEDAMKSVSLICAIYQSAKTQKMVELN
jgi:predicted dehydrogenase